MGWLKAHVRNKMVAGTLAAIPVAVTIFILWYVDSKAREVLHVRTPLVGIAITIVVIYVLGVFVTSVVGQFMLRVFDHVIRRVPGLRDLYRSWKQVALTDTQVGIFAHVVLVPDDAGRGCVLGFTSGHAIDGDPGLSCVFVPGSPNPTTGKLYFVPTTRCIRLQMSPQEALKMIISGGNYVPGAVGKGTVGRYPLPGQW
ncbi:MAG TPA: DUF502 domain-containing protein [Polyangia bacterium]|nr:DUF502 domain-containing protein [Polyangia bacterium]